MGFGEQGKMAFISGEQMTKGQIFRGTKTILGNREYKNTKFEGTEEQTNVSEEQGNILPPPPPPPPSERASHIT